MSQPSPEGPHPNPLPQAGEGEGVTLSAAEFDVFGCGLDGTNLIEASAGTGKTWNLCGLYLRLLLERQLEVQRVLVVTFTHAATAELLFDNHAAGLPERVLVGLR